MGPSARPPARTNAGMVYDSTADRLILFGGHTVPQSGWVWFNDTWAYEYLTNSWTNRSPARAPPGGDPAGVAYDSRANRMIVLFGTSGMTVNGTTYGGTFFNETWAYDYAANAWTNRSPARSPPADSITGMVYDSHAGRTLAIGTRALWIYDYGLNTWAAVPLGNGVPSLLGYSLAYDSAADRMIQFGGWRLRQTWAYDVNSDIWTNLTRGPQPDVVNAAMVYDSGADRVVLVGGELPALSGWPFVSNDTWAFNYDNRTWTKVALATRPPAGYRQAIAYDSATTRIFLIGGTLLRGFSNETWSLQYPYVAPTVPSPFSLLWSIGLTVTVSAAVGFAIFLAWKRRRLRRKGWERE